MRVKRYVVDSLPDALTMIRRELGQDAVILNTKQLKTGGFLGLFGKKKIEVIAAVDGGAARDGGTPVRKAAPQSVSAAAAAAIQGASSEREPNRPHVGSRAAARAYRSVNQAMTAVAETKDADHAPGLDARLPGTAAAAPAHTSSHLQAKKPSAMRAEAAPMTAVPPVEHKERSAIEEKQTVDAVERFKQAARQTIEEAAARTSPAKSPSVDTEELLQEIKEMKALVAKLTDGASANEAGKEGAYDSLDGLDQRLLEQGVLPAITAELKERVKAAVGSQPIDAQQARALYKEYLLQLFSPPAGISDNSRIVQFIGPTGVGKTTTIAKLAAEQVLKHNKRIGFITSDTYRIAAIDQLKTYASILNVPVEVVFTSEELEEALQKLNDCDLIFMDTAGRNYRDQASVDELNGLISQHGQSETYLVVSLVSKYNDIKAIIDNFQHFKLDKVLWTKMDETSSYGSILNVLYEYSLPVSYITNGQNVPDDISLLNPEAVVEHLLGEDANG
ncbi:hypothetical protein PRECH8_10080 [Insulibacter thermoxylanivorax]|uniref:Flagellar biosynthesis protein FlhF n=1 Tax=Insulibacter thermoxylanivorax TaxID=2749268 RepID=A0A916QBJ7_9BACL|nr:flagellar biosynthesis protein FlhF [Insulibacter thermoxylanivorax]GFR37712.1 hypothetical protein PRECH8_10080 [Insulibacter thermoxylanivorax]